MLYFLYGLWFIRTLKYVLFWLYLWQLKEYHIGRFLDHFNTEKGKKLLLNPLLDFKIIFLLFFISTNDIFISFLVFVYLAETIIFLRQIYLKAIKKPVRTAKSLFLTGVSVSVVILFLIWSAKKNPAWILGFDIFLPVIISLIVLLFQPVAVFLRKKTLKKAGEKIKQFPGLKVIAITGSYGKTSTKEFLTTILSKKYKVLSTSKHQNAEIGIAKCILNDLNEKHQIFIAEVGAYNKGKVKEVCEILKPKIGIVTGVNEQHLSLFGSLENLLTGEGGRELAQFLEQNGLLVVNGDNKYCLNLIKKFNGKEKIYSESNRALNADIWAESITVRRNYVSFIAKNKAGELADFKANVLGKQNVQNLLGAVLVAKELGMSFGEISDAMTHIKQEQAGMVLKQGKHGIDIIDSSYSANPDGVFADLDYLNIFGNPSTGSGQAKKIIVMPCLIELGEKSKIIHEQIGKKIGKVCGMAIITSKDDFEQLKRGVMESGMKESNILFLEKPAEIYSVITLFCKSGDAILLEGRVPNKLIELLLG